MEIQRNEDYKLWLSEIKDQIRSSQIKASLSVNNELLRLYWDLGQRISQKLAISAWGSKAIEFISKDLQISFPEFDGFSKRNLLFMKQWFEFYQFTHIENIAIAKQVVSQLPKTNSPNDRIKHLLSLIPWGHNVIIVQKIKNVEQALFYILKTLENDWSRNILSLQIENQLFERQGKAITNFQLNLPKSQSDLAQEILKDPYKFDFLNLTESAQEKDIEEQLVKHITRFLLELGTGFAFIGQQYKLKIEENEYKLDLLFYHIHLRCYVVVELKSVSFKPEFTGKLSFYLSAVDDLLRKENDNPTIGLLLCKSKNKIEAEYALKGIKQPIGVADYELSKAIPDNLKSQLPTVKDIENELNQ